MKHISLLILALFSLVITSCGDINSQFVPTVENPNSNWNLTFLNNFSPIKFDPKTVIFSHSFDDANSQLTIEYSFTHDKRADWDQAVSIVNNGTTIDIVYTQNRTIPSGAVTQASTDFKHVFTYSNIGKGEGSEIPVRIRKVYTNPALGQNSSDAVRNISKP